MCVLNNDKYLRKENKEEEEIMQMAKGREFQETEGKKEERNNKQKDKQNVKNYYDDFGQRSSWSWREGKRGRRWPRGNREGHEMNEGKREGYEGKQGGT